MIRLGVSLCFGLVMVSGAAAAWGQAAASGASAIQPLPKDPKEILQLAAQVNGFSSPDMKPWHVKATYQGFDDQGRPNEQGTFEEWWAAPNRYKASFTSPSFTQTEYVTEKGRYRVGARTDIPLLPSMVRARLITPIPLQTDTLGVRPRREEKPMGKETLVCVELSRPLKSLSGAPVGLFPTYCFERDNPSLRVSGSFGEMNTVYQRVGILHGHFIGQELRITDFGRPYVNVNLINGSLLSSVNDADFTPPADAEKVPEPQETDVSGDVIGIYKMSGAAPRYPVEAKEFHVQGTVQLAVAIDTDGYIRDLRVLEAPDASLAISAMQAVRTWRYRPYLLNGEPVLVHTTIHVTYNLGG